jgi:hypothetical protein
MSAPESKADSLLTASFVDLDPERTWPAASAWVCEAAGLAFNGFHHLAGALDKSFDQGD